jgi:CheY-like chemotaxis protein
MAEAVVRADAARLTAAVASGRAPLVLVADDVDVNQSIARFVLLELGCEVECVADGEAASRAARAARFALILMDDMMPRMDGFEATRAIRRHEFALGRRTPIVAYGVWDDRKYVDLWLEAGADGFLFKPVRDRGEFERVVARFISLDDVGAAAG